MNEIPSLQSVGGHALVLGMGRSGMAAVRLLRRNGWKVTMLDDGQSAPSADRTVELRALGVQAWTGPDAGRVPPADSSLAVVSPGVPVDAPLVKTLMARGIPVCSELELGWRATRSKILAVTGSNGKSTLASVCHAALAAAARDVRIGGNFGDPLSDLALRYPHAEWLVVEVSSFQMETSPCFHPDVGVWLNLFPTHLDRHGDMKTYAELKARMFLNMEPDQQAVLFEHAEQTCPVLRAVRCGKKTFGLSRSADVCYHEGEILWNSGTGGLNGSFSVAGTMFANEIMGPTAAAATAAVMAAGVAPDNIQTALGNHQPLPHRLRKVACVNGICFFDDAKSTNLSALKAALDVVGGPLRLLAGGRLQEPVTATRNESLRNRVVAVYLWGEAADTLAKAWSPMVPCRVYRTLVEALNSAWRDARTGENILLSPGCSSHDQYEDFNQRGAEFLHAVNRITQGVNK